MAILQSTTIASTTGTFALPIGTSGERPTATAGMVRYNEPGNLTLSVYITHLEELNVDIRYGDYIGYPDSEEKLRFYTVSNDGKVTSDNKHKMFGFKPHYRTIVCVPTQQNEFRGV